MYYNQMIYPTSPRQTAWRALFQAYARARVSVDNPLKSQGFPPLEVYDILLELDRDSAEDGVQAKLLEDRLLLPQYGVSRLVDRLVRQGLIRRSPHPTDRRSTLLTITLKGRELRHSMWEVYGPAIATCFDGRLDESEIAELAALLGRLARGADRQ